VKLDRESSGGVDLAFTVQPLGRVLIAAAVASLACGCATTPPYDVVTAHHARIALDHARASRQVVLRVDGKPQPLPGLTDAQIDLVWSAAKSDFVVLHGATDACPQSTWLAAITGADVAVHPIGLCSDKIVLTEDGDRLLVRRVPLRGSPAVIVFRDGDPIAYAVQHDLPLPRRSVSAHHVEPAQDRRPAGETDTSAVAAATPPVPAVSAPVGEDVVPAPVGAGPLPSGAGRPVPPFAAPPATR